MDPWMQPTTAPEQHDLESEEQILVDPPRVERGWMEPAWFPPETPRTSFGITVLAWSVALGFPLAMVVLLPLMLRWLAS
jgi:hypothetical protein